MSSRERLSMRPSAPSSSRSGVVSSGWRSGEMERPRLLPLFCDEGWGGGGGHSQHNRHDNNTGQQSTTSRNRQVHACMHLFGQTRATQPTEQSPYAYIVREAYIISSYSKQYSRASRFLVFRPKCLTLSSIHARTRSTCNCAQEEQLGCAPEARPYSIVS